MELAGERRFNEPCDSSSLVNLVGPILLDEEGLNTCAIDGDGFGREAGGISQKTRIFERNGIDAVSVSSDLFKVMGGVDVYGPVRTVEARSV
jgi:hypothetical protein